MSDVIELLRAAYAAHLSTRCLKRNCSASIKSLVRKELVIIDCDSYWERRSRDEGIQACDFVMFYNEGAFWVILIEIKGGGFDADEVIGQLRAGAQLADNLLADNDFAKFRPVLVSRKTHTMELRKLGRPSNRIRFRKRSEFVSRISCGSPLEKAL